MPRRSKNVALQTAPAVRSDELPRRVVAAATEFLRHMGVEGDILCRDRRETEAPHLWLEILARDSGLLIGERGSTLRALEHVLRRVLRPLTGERTRIIVDVNAYRVRRTEVLRRQAREAARRARTTGRAVLLEPMNAADRRVVHLALATEEGIATESEGEDPQRRVIVRPTDPLA